MTTRAPLLSPALRLVPPALAELGRHWLGRGVTFSGEFGSWAEARARCSGYDDAAILGRVLAATRAVREGRAAFERDAALFDSPQPPFPLLTMLLWAALRAGGVLNVLDFGGALGSSYFQCRPFLGALTRLSWTVVEQPRFVEAGRREIADGPLAFHPTLEEAWAASPPDLVLLSGVLQYVPDPEAVLARIVEREPAYIVIDRTPLNEADRDLVAVQHVPESMGRASYPVRLFSRGALLGSIEQRYRRVAEFDAVDGVIGVGRHRSRFKGYGYLAPGAAGDQP